MKATVYKGIKITKVVRKGREMYSFVHSDLDLKNVYCLIDCNKYGEVAYAGLITGTINNLLDELAGIYVPHTEYGFLAVNLGVF